MTSSQIGFQSTRPARGATLVTRNPEHTMKFQSTRPARGATATAAKTAEKT